MRPVTPNDELQICNFGHMGEPSHKYYIFSYRGDVPDVDLDNNVYVHRDKNLYSYMNMEDYFTDVRSALEFIKINFPNNKWRMRKN